MKNVFFLLILMFLFSCSKYKKSDLGQPDEEVEYVVTDWNRGDISESLNISDFFEIHKIVKLESQSESVVGEIYNLLLVENKIFINNRDEKWLQVFDKNGKHIKKIFSLGRGPEEYLSIRDFDYFEEDGFIFNDPALYHLHYYNTDLEFVKKERYQYRFGLFSLTSSGKYILDSKHRENDFLDDEKELMPSIMVLNKDFTVQSALLPYHASRLGVSSGWGRHDLSIVRSNAGLFYKDPDSRIIYSISDDGEVNKHFSFFETSFSGDINSLNMTAYREVIKNSTGPSYLSNVTVTDRFVYYEFDAGERRLSRGVYNKAKRKNHMFTYKPDHALGGAFESIPHKGEDDFLILKLNTATAHKDTPNAMLREALIDTDDYDNPILLFLKFKDQ